MGLDRAHYHGWNGRLASSWWATLALVRVALLQLFRRKVYWLLMAMGLIQFVAFWAAIYLVTQLPDLPPEGQRFFLRAFGFSTDTAAGQDDGFTNFMDRQSVVVMILLAFAGGLLVGSDFRSGALPFYLSRRIDRRHYIAGKLLAVSAVVALMTVVPALLLFLEFGMLSPSTEFWTENWRIPLAILTYGAVLCTVLSTLLVSLSAYLQRMAPIAITWASLFVMLEWLGRVLQRTTDNDWWLLLDPWRDMRLVGQLLFTTYESDADWHRALAATVVLVVICAISLATLVRRVRAVEIVT